MDTFEKSGNFDIYNIASGIPVTIKEVLSNIMQISSNQNIEVNFDSSKPTMIPIRMIDISKVRNEIGWQPKTSIYEGLKRTFEWYSNTYRTFNPEGQKI